LYRRKIAEHGTFGHFLTEKLGEYMPEKSRLSTWLPILISVVALFVSLGTLYYDHWREKHSLKAVISRIEYRDPTTVEIVIRNVGNKSEVLSSAKLISAKDDSGGGRLSSEQIGPFVIEPNEAIVQKFQTKPRLYKELKQNDELDGSNGLHIGIIFSILDFRSNSRGERIYVEKYVPFTIIHFDENGNITGAKPAKENTESFVELYSGQIIE
jgi:hypothetical protein